jgi:hypothetical protein
MRSGDQAVFEEWDLSEEDEAAAWLLRGSVIVKRGLNENPPKTWFFVMTNP